MSKTKLVLFKVFYNFFWYKKLLKKKYKETVLYRTWCDARSLASTEFMIEIGKSVSFKDLENMAKDVSNKDLRIIDNPNPVTEDFKAALTKEIPEVTLDKGDI